MGSEKSKRKFIRLRPAKGGATPDSARKLAKTDEPGEAKGRPKVERFGADGSYKGTMGFSSLGFIFPVGNTSGLDG